METATDGEKPSGSPRNLKVEPIASTKLKVSWDPPDHNTWNGEILGYHVGYKEHRMTADQYIFKTVESHISSANVALGLARTAIYGLECNLTNLNKYTRYSIVLQAFNALGLGPLSSEVVVSTLEDGEFLR